MGRRTITLLPKFLRYNFLHVAALLTLNANWFGTLTVKQWEIMINNDVLLISATNEETPYEQLLHLLFSSNIENQTIKKKQALKILRQKYLFSLKTKTFKPKDNWQFIIVKFFLKTSNQN